MKASAKAVRLKDVCSIITKGTTPTSIGYRFTSCGVNFIKAEAVTLEGRVNHSTFVKVSHETHEKLKRSQLEERDILFSIAGMKLGKTGLVKREYLPANTNQALAIIRVDVRQALPEFLHYYFLNPAHYRMVNSLTAQAAQPNINLTDLRNLTINLPDIPTQRKIAGILSAYDDLIENNLRRIKILEEMAQSLYRDWFVHFRFPGHESARFVDSPLGRIPEGWEVKKLGDLAKQMRQNVPKGNLESPKPYVGLEHIPRKSLALDNWEMVEELGSNKLAFEAGEVLFGKIRPYFHKVSIAPFDGLCSADTIVIRARRQKLRALVTSCLFSEAFVAHASATANGAKMPRANWNVLENYPIALPPDKLLQGFTSVFENIDHQTRNLIGRDHCLRKTRDLLLLKLLNKP